MTDNNPEAAPPRATTPEPRCECGCTASVHDVWGCALCKSRCRSYRAASSPPGAVGGPTKVCDHCGCTARAEWSSPRCEYCVPGWLRPVPAVSPAAPSSEIAGLLDALVAHVRAATVSRGMDGNPTAARAAVDEYVATISARIAEAARDSEQIREAVDHAMGELWKAGRAAYLGNPDWNRIDAVRESLRAALRASRSTGDTENR